jgi:hypothetical protein
LLKFQNLNGGFSTYSKEDELLTALNDKNISNVNGWLSVHDCVSAVSFYFLANYNLNNNYFIKTKKYFDDKNINNIISYWWTDEIYTYYYLAKTYHFLGEFEKLNQILSILKIKQNINGSFSDKYGENLFYTGLALEIMLLDHRNEVIDLIEKTVVFLLNNQFTDGSWDNSCALHVPNSHDLIPSKKHMPIASLGMNVRAKEFNRLFTTTTILQSLVIYEQKYNTNTI